MPKKAIGPITSGLLSGLSSLAIDKIFGNGKKGRFLIPQNKIDQLIKHKKSPHNMSKETDFRSITDWRSATY